MMWAAFCFCVLLQVWTVALADSATCRYPCILNNGCECNGAIAHESGGQNFGTCEACAEGWGGWDCTTVVQTCLNGNLIFNITANSSRCECPAAWTGPRCGEIMCLHSTNGTGPEAVAPPSALDNQCHDCLPQWGGVNCEQCLEDSACPNGTICNATFVPQGSYQNIECELTSPTWIYLLGDGRPGVKGIVKTSWSKPSGWNDTFNFDGSGRISFWRLEPQAVWLDPFFYCNLQNCTAFLIDQTIPPVLEHPPDAFKPLQRASSALLYATLGILLLNAFIPGRRLKLRKRILVATLIALGLELVVYLLLFSQWGHSVVVAARSERFVQYQCQDARCECAPDPKNFSWQYWCIGSFLGNDILPAVRGEVDFRCNYDSDECELWSPTLLNGEHIPGACTAGTCVAKSTSSAESNGFTFILNPDHAAVYAAAALGAVALLLLVHFLIDRCRVNRRFVRFHAAFAELAPSSETDPFVNGARTPLLAGAEPATVCLRASNLGVCVDGRQILHGVSLNLQSGSTLALMGPSGAGKTTLLDLLSMRPKAGVVTGTVTLNGTVVSNGDGTGASYKHLLGYVAQEDTLIPALTVRETIYFAARLKLPAPISDFIINEIVDDTIERLYLTKCQHTQVGNDHKRGISGGEKRRVSIATELVANPRILVLDEPTSGLDSISAFEVVRAITSVARRPHIRAFAKFFRFRPIVVFSIHQPSESIYRMFDQICLLQDGYMLYCGPAQSALERLHGSAGVQSVQRTRSGSDLPQITIQRLVGDVEGKERYRVESLTRRETGEKFDRGTTAPTTFTNQGEALLMLSHQVTDTAVLEELNAAAMFEVESQLNGTAHAGNGNGHSSPPRRDATLEEMDAAVILYRPSVWQQFSILARRTAAALIGSYHLVAAHAVFTLFLGITLSFIYASEKLDLAGTENKAGLFTFMLLVVGFSSLSCLELFIAERRLFEVEHENGYYGTLPYFTVKVLFDFVPLRIIPTAVLAACIYFPIGMRTDNGNYFLWYVEILVIFALASTSLTLIVGIVAPAFGPAALFASLLVLWNTAFGGLMIQGDTIPPFFVPFRYTSPSFYAYESLMVNELLGQNCTLDPVSKDGVKQQVHVPIEGITLLYNLGLDPQHFGRDVAILHGQTLLTLLLAFLILTIRVHLPRIRERLKRCGSPSPSKRLCESAPLAPERGGGVEAPL